jgi:hypothetical protein
METSGFHLELQFEVDKTKIWCGTILTEQRLSNLASTFEATWDNRSQAPPWCVRCDRARSCYPRRGWDGSRGRFEKEIMLAVIFLPFGIYPFWLVRHGKSQQNDQVLVLSFMLEQ